jgi:Predicted exporters of the RND superfamily
MKRLLSFIYKHAKAIIIVIALLTVFFAWQATKIGINASYSAFIPWGEYWDTFEGGVAGQKPVLSKVEDTAIDTSFIPSTTVYSTGLTASTTGTSVPEKQEEDYPYSTNYLVLIKGDNIYDKDSLNTISEAIKSLEDTRELSDSSSVLDFVTLEKNGSRLVTVPMAANKGEEWTDESATKLKERIDNDPIVPYFLVGGSKNSMMFSFRVSDISPAQEERLSRLLDPVRDLGLTVCINGGAVINNRVMSYLNKDLITLIGLCLLVILVIYYLSFRSKRSVLLPMSVSVIGLIWTFGTMAMMKIDITILNIVTPCMVLTLGSAYSIHILSNYYSNFGKEPEVRIKSTSDVLETVTLACLTTVCGFLVLLVSKTSGLREFGISVSFGIFYCAVLAITYLPAVLHLLKPAKQTQVSRFKTGPVAKVVNRTSTIVTNGWKILLIVLLIITAVFFVVKDRISIDSNYMSYFPKSDPFGEESRTFAAEMGGTNPFTVEITAPEGSDKFFLKTENLKKVYEYEQKILECPDILQSISFSSYVAFANDLYNGEHTIPDSAGLLNMLSKLVILMQRQTGASLDSILSSDGNKVSLTLQHWDNLEEDLMTTSSSTRVLHTLTENLDLLPEGTKVRIGGDPVVNVKFSNRLLHDQKVSMVLSIIIVFIITVIAFKSFITPLYTLVPIFSGIMINYIFMFLMGIPFDMVTVSFGSIAIGCGIDDAIHFMIRYNNLKKAGITDTKECVSKTITSTGKPIILTTLSIVLGLSMLGFASYMPIRYFGLLMSVTLFSCMFSTLIFMPSVIIMLESLSSRRKKNEKPNA